MLLSTPQFFKTGHLQLSVSLRALEEHEDVRCGNSLMFLILCEDDVAVSWTKSLYYLLRVLQR